MPAPPRAPAPRKKFAYDDYPETPRLEPPAPTSDYAQKKIPANYIWSERKHELITKYRGDRIADVGTCGAAAGWTDMRIDWAVDANSAPANFPYFARGRDSTRVYLTELFKTI